MTTNLMRDPNEIEQDIFLLRKAYDNATPTVQAEMKQRYDRLIEEIDEFYGDHRRYYINEQAKNC